MAIDVSNLSGYFNDELRFNIATKAVLEATDLKNLNVFDNVNGTMLLSTVDTTIYVSTDECSTRTDSGSTVFAGNTLATEPLNIYNEVCNKKLQRYFLGKKGANEQGIDGELMTALIEDKLSKAEFEIMKIRWQGSNSASGVTYATVTGNLLAQDGFLQKATELSAVTVNVTKSAITASNSVAVIDSYMSNIPAAIEGRMDLALHLSPADFRNAMVGLRNANYLQSSANYDANSEGVTELLWPGQAQCVIRKQDGLVGVASGTALLTYDENMAVGGLKDPAGLDFKVWYSEDDDKVKFNLYALHGVQFVYGEHVVRFI
jgi:hypothetical protein